jgi:hypothetical protein
MTKLSAARAAAVGMGIIPASTTEDSRIKQEAQYDEILSLCVQKPSGHQVEQTSTRTWYTVTTLAASELYGGTRTVAIFDGFAEANDFVLANTGDIWETSYMLCVIEATIPNSLYGRSGPGAERPAYWYMWCGEDDGGYVPIHAPAVYCDLHGWGIG